jgi:ABC-type dipeptide/oligopeptide/nickel transport system ATPase component
MGGQLIFKGNQIDAKYKQQDIPLHRHNLFIEALPNILDMETVVKRIRRVPVYKKEDRDLSELQRIHRVQTIANYVEPLPFHIDLEAKFSRMIRHGYVARNPIKAEYVKQMRSGFEGLDWGGVDDQYEPIIKSTASGFAIVGPSGSGKSTAVESVLGLYPQVINHQKYYDTTFERKQIVWLKLECPKEGSAKSLCLNFFQSIDSIFENNTKYFDRYSSKSYSAEVLLPIMASIANLFGLGVLIIDEIQRIKLASSGGSDSLMNFLVQLVNIIGVPIVLVGTPRCLNILTEHFSNARRLEGQGDIMESNYMEDDEIWAHFIENLWKYQYTKIDTPLTSSISKAIYEESYGIIDLAVKLYMLVQWEAIGGEEKITAGLIREVSKDNLRLVKRSVSNLKSSGYQAAVSNDIFASQVDMEKYLKRAKEKVILNGKNNTLHNQEIAAQNEEQFSSSPLMMVAQWLVDAGIEPELAQKSAREALVKNKGDLDIAVAKREAFQVATFSAFENKQSVKKQRKKKTSSIEKEEMEKLLKEDEVNRIEILELKGGESK